MAPNDPANAPRSPRTLALSSGGELVAAPAASRLAGFVAALERSFGLSLRGQVLVAAVATAWIVVSLGQLQEFAVRANERDAVALLARLGPAVARGWAELGEPHGHLRESAAAGARGEAFERLGDVQWIDGGQRMRRHGYVFALDADDTGAPFLVAWPWEHGRTGRASFAWSTAGALEHPNRAGTLSGPHGAPDATTPGWRAAR